MTSEDFRRDPAKRSWETSYTRRVIGKLHCMRAFVRFFKGDDSAILAAIELLCGYWKDLHVPYEQRDKAIADLKRLDEVSAGLRKELAKQDNIIKTLRISRDFWIRQHKARGSRMDIMRSAYYKLRTKLVSQMGEEAYQRLGDDVVRETLRPVVFYPGQLPRTLAQPSFRCVHWPLATSNVFDGRTTCEHGCHTVPLEFWHSGTHRAPLNRNWQNDQIAQNTGKGL